MIHLVKLCVGAHRLEDLARWQAWQTREAKAGGLAARPVCGTRAWPKRAEEVLAGGSLYWVIKGVIQARQRIVAIDEVRDEHGRRCGLYLDPALILTEPQPKRAFQGWRYLMPEEAPADLGSAAPGGEAPEELRRQLVALGAW